MYSQNIIRKTFAYKDLQTAEKGRLDTYNPSTVESTNFKNWIAILDLKTCKFCRDMHGKIFLIDEIHEKEPPVHYYCRCIIEKMRSIIAGNATKDGNQGADWYLKNTGLLPNYYVSFEEAKKAGWRNGKSPAKYVPGKILTRGIYENENKHLPDAPGRIWYEADINYYEGRRNRHRILWSNDGLIFVTYDHYETFYEIV